MKGLSRAVVSGLALCGTLAGGTLQAANGLLIVEKSSGAGVPSTNQIQIEANRMRVETAGPSGAKQVVIFDGARGVLMMIDNDRKTYTEITKEEADKLGGQVSDAMAQMKKQIDGLPPEQRAQFEAMMKGRLGGAGVGAAAAPKTVYRKTGKGEVGKWACDKYEGYAGETKTMELCTVAPQTLGFTAADFAVSKQLAEFFAKLLPQMRNQMFAIGDAEQGFEGVPVRRVVTMGGREMISEITEVSRQSFGDSSYAAPAGYKKEAYGPAGRGR